MPIEKRQWHHAGSGSGSSSGVGGSLLCRLLTLIVTAVASISFIISMHHDAVLVEDASAENLKISHLKKRSAEKIANAVASNGRGEEVTARIDTSVIERAKKDMLSLDELLLGHQKTMKEVDALLARESVSKRGEVVSSANSHELKHAPPASEKSSGSFLSLFSTGGKLPEATRLLIHQVSKDGETDTPQPKLSRPMPWKEFVDLPMELPISVLPLQTRLANASALNLCPSDIVTAMTTPLLNKEEFKWCQWAFTGGKVVVGKSYGNLQSKDRDKYDRLNCNAVAKGNNPTCDDTFGDYHIQYWKKNKVMKDLCNKSGSGSKVYCVDSQSEARFCQFENVMLDFSKMHDVARPGRTKSRKWDEGFLATDCGASNDGLGFYEFYKPSVDPNSAVCDFVFNETVVPYSHDDINNLGHSMSDFLMVWAIMWLGGVAQYSRDITFINIDAIRMGHNRDDQLSAFGLHYKSNFRRVLKAVDFGGGKVCFKKLLFQSRPLVLFTWDGWWVDMPCTFKGPSSLFQRWNLQIRQNYDLLRDEDMPTNRRTQILLIIRTLKSGSNSMYGTRTFGNTDAILEGLRAFESQGVSVVAKDLAQLAFEEQIRLIASSSIVVGMHGAGMASTTHMAVGTRHCCGVVEIFPKGQFETIKGYGNMARRMGHI